MPSRAPSPVFSWLGFHWLAFPGLACPWNDRAGRLSWLKLAVFCAAFAPALWLAVQSAADMLGAKPVTEALHQAGDWAVRFLLLSLAVTPLRHLAQWPQLIMVRRMLGLTVLAYALLHLGLYVVQQSWDLWKVTSEIVLRFYLTIGFVALAGLIVLGLTSTDGMIRRLGAQNWNRLHRSVYALALLSLIHFFLQSKLDVTQPVLMAGFFFWLMGFRLLRRFRRDAGVLPLVLLAAFSAFATALAEAGWYAAMTGAPALRILAANLDVEVAIRPALWVLAAGVAMAMLAVARRKSSVGQGRSKQGLDQAKAAIQDRADSYAQPVIPQ